MTWLNNVEKHFKMPQTKLLKRDILISMEEQNNE